MQFLSAYPPVIKRGLACWKIPHLQMIPEFSIATHITILRNIYHIEWKHVASHLWNMFYGK